MYEVILAQCVVNSENPRYLRMKDKRVYTPFRPLQRLLPLMVADLKILWPYWKFASRTGAFQCS